MAEHIVKVKGLTKKYGGKKVVDDISFSVKKARFSAYLGLTEPEGLLRLR